MYVQLTYNEGNGIYNSNVGYKTNDQVKEELAKLDGAYEEDKGVIYWDDGSVTGIFIPIDKDIIATYHRSE